MAKILSLLIIFSTCNLLAQQPVQRITIKGLLVDSASNMPLSFANIFLLNEKTALHIGSSFTNNDGTFELKAPVNLHYILAFSYVGYLPKTINILGADSAKKWLLDIGKVAMTAISGQLKEVSVIAIKPLVKQEIDRISYDVQSDPESKANDALEMLRKLPMITVDGSDNIQLKGSSSFRIFINGKPSALMANDPSEVLKAMPAATIQKIEVITVPPAKYDAEGITGIINIITLKKSDQGFNGSIFGRYNNILGLNAFFGLGHQPLTTNEGRSQLNNFSPATDLSQQGQNVNGGNFNNGQAELSYEFDSLNLLTASIDFINRKFVQNTFRVSELLNLPDSLIQSYQLNNISENLMGALDLSANYQLGFRKSKDELLTLSYQYASTTNNQDNAVSSTDWFNYSGSDYNQQNETSTKEQTFQLDFVMPVQKLIIEAGTKAIFRANYSNFGDQNFDQASGQYIADTSLTNQFIYHQNVYSLYNSYQLKLRSWTFKGGLRLENTAINSGFTSNDTAPGQNYLNLIPAISIQRSYEKTGSFTLGFTERIQRPSLQQVNPFVDRSNPDFIVTGNAGLRPVLNHIIELSFSKFAKASINTSLNYAFSNNTIQKVTSLTSDTLTETTYLNVGKNQSAGINLSTNYPITNKLNFSINAQLSHLWITGIYNAHFYQNEGNQGNVYAFAKYNFGHDFTTNINFGYFSGNVFLQGKSSDYIYTTVNIIKDFLKKKATATITLYNPFALYNTYSSYTKTPDFEQTSFSQNYYRMIRLAFNYKFGHLNGTIQTNHRNIKNDDVPGSKNNENQ